MGQYYEVIPENVLQWILEQKVFWVATAPLSGAGHVNVSPKGGDCFGLLDNKTFWYHELTGSGNETVSHLYEPGNGRITIQFNAFTGPPRILRLYGHGRVLERGTKDFDEFVEKHDVKVIPASRSIIIVDAHQVGTSCGYSVPYYDFKEFRPTLTNHFEKLEKAYNEGNQEKSMPKYWAAKNSWSVDGLPGMQVAQKTMKSDGITPLQKMVGGYADPVYHGRRNVGGYGIEHLLLVALISALLTAILMLYGPHIAQHVDLPSPAQAKQAIWSPLATLR